jgi:hypothetical protein
LLFRDLQIDCLLLQGLFFVRQQQEDDNGKNNGAEKSGQE